MNINKKIVICYYFNHNYAGDMNFNCKSIKNVSIQAVSFSYKFLVIKLSYFVIKISITVAVIFKFNLLQTTVFVINLILKGSICYVIVNIIRTSSEYKWSFYSVICYINMYEIRTYYISLRSSLYLLSKMLCRWTKIAFNLLWHVVIFIQKIW